MGNHWLTFRSNTFTIACVDFSEEAPVTDQHDNGTNAGLPDPKQAQLALEQGIARINDALEALEQVQKTREEIFELVVSV